MANKTSPINRSIVLGCAVLIIVLSLILSIQTNYAFTDALYDQYNARLRDVVTFLEHNTDADDLRECIQNVTSSPKRDELQRLVNQMVDDFETEFIYIVLPLDEDGGKLYSIVSSTSEAERLAGDDEDWPIMYDCSEDYTRDELQSYLDAWNADDVVFFRETSDWGVCYTGCKPLKTSDGETIALVCADYLVDTVNKTVSAYVVRYALLIVVACTVFGALLAMWLRNRVTRPIQALEQSALRFAQMSHELDDIGDLSIETEDLQASGEVKMLIDAVAKLSKEMKEQAASALVVKNYAKEIEEENQRLSDKAESAARIAELTKSMTTLLNNMPGMYFSKDIESRRYVACNQAFAEYAGKPDPEGVAGLTDHEIFDEVTADHFVEDDSKAIAMDEPYVFFEDVLDAGGEHRQFRTTKLKYTDHTGKVCLLGMCLDFTELTRVKSASTMYLNIVRSLSASYSRLYYVNLKTDVFIEYRSDRGNEDLSEERQGTDFFGCSVREARDQLYPEDVNMFLESFTKDKVTRALDEHGEFTLSYRLMTDGEPVLVSLRASRMQGDESSILIGVNTSENLSAKNELTGLIMKDAFFINGQELLREHPEGWCVIAMDLEHFKLFNEWYGMDEGDKLLSQIGALLARVEEITGGLACYMGMDDFCVLAPYDEERIHALYDDIHRMIMDHGTSVGFMPAVGVCKADGKNTIQELYDRASLASHHAKENYHTRIRLFEESMYKKTERDYQILSDFQKALKDHELFIMLQPQCEIAGGKVVGAESLVRWKKKSDGQMVSPGVFVPVLEQYGFVTDLDKFVWEEVCAWQRRWIDGGHTPLPVSVNVSQIDIFSIDVPNYFDMLLKKYDLPVDVVKVEITESAYVGDGIVADTVKRLREKGFLVLMDDFGSGYSSLNMLRNLNVDIIKLDAQFLRMNGDDRKGVHILESIVNMAKTMGVPIIVEGVETQEETDFISSLGCRYVQGYFFYRPMPVPDFEALIGDEANIDTNGFVFKVREEFHTREFLDQNVFSDIMLNNILGPVAFFLLHGEDLDCIRYNQQFYNEVNTEQFDLLMKSAQKLVVDEDLPVLYGILEHAMNDPLNGAADVVRFKRANGKFSQFRLQFFYLDEDESGMRFYGSVRDVTQLERLNGQMRMITNLSNDEIVFVRRRESGLLFQVTVHGLEEAFGCSREEFEQELNSGSFRRRIKDEDYEMLMRLIDESGDRMADYSPAFPVLGADGETIPMQVRFDAVQDKSSGVEYLLMIRRADK